MVLLTGHFPLNAIGADRIQISDYSELSKDASMVNQGQQSSEVSPMWLTQFTFFLWPLLPESSCLLCLQ